MWFIAANVPGRPRIWLYKSLWLFSSNKYGGFARIYYASCPVLLLPSYRALDYGTLLSSLSFSQSPIVSMCVCVCVCVCVYINSTNIFGQCVVSQWYRVLAKKSFGLLIVHASVQFDISNLYFAFLLSWRLHFLHWLLELDILFSEKLFKGKYVLLYCSLGERAKCEFELWVFALFSF